MAKAADVVIVGGGIIGAATAYHLGLQGISSVVLERGEIGREASGRNAGTFNLLNDRIADDRPLNLLRKALGRWHDLSEELGYDLEVDLTLGTLLLGEAEQDHARLMELKGLYAGKGIELDLLDRQALGDTKSFVGPHVQGALFCAYGGMANPRQAAWAFANRAKDLGARFETGTDVVSVERRGDRFSIQTRHGAYDAAKVVLAAGPWTNALLAPYGYQVPLRIRYFQASVTAATDYFLPHCIRRVGGMITLKQTRRGNCILGGGWQGHSHFPAPGAISEEALRGNMEIAARVVPRYGSLSMLRVWGGYDGSSIDEQPVIDEVPGVPGLVVATGSSGGFTHGPVFGEMIADLLTGHTDRHEYDRFTFARFGEKALVTA
jgi:Glycine/D-amino acid oxidases (deaminating)